MFSFYFTILKFHLFMCWRNSSFQQLLFQSKVSQDPSENTLVWRFAAHETSHYQC